MIHCHASSWDIKLCSTAQNSWVPVCASFIEFKENLAIIPKDNLLKGMASEIEAPLQAANSTGLHNISHQEISRIPDTAGITETIYTE